MQMQLREVSASHLSVQANARFPAGDKSLYWTPGAMTRPNMRCNLQRLTIGPS